MWFFSNFSEFINIFKPWTIFYCYFCVVLPVRCFSSYLFQNGYYYDSKSNIGAIIFWTSAFHYQKTLVEELLLVMVIFCLNLWYCNGKYASTCNHKSVVIFFTGCCWMWNTIGICLVHESLSWKIWNLSIN